ncbi:FUSC family protein [uncultured Demequina sp.]|uniref:FUSC family protein n=1 Tax=uncultured Demequina sp. TaxID=693499 RepID=UPI0025DF79CC|nr:FUSC family protein [uncultured Demequina sp.]
MSAPADAGRLSAWRPPVPAVRVAAIAVGVFGALVAAGWLLGGAGAAVGAFLGGVSILALAVQPSSWWELGVFSALVGACVAGAVAFDGAVAIAACVAISVVATAPFALRYGPVTAVVPVLVAIAGDGAGDVEPVRALMGTVVAALAFAAIVRALGMRQASATPLPTRVMVAHLATMSAATAIATGVVIAAGLAHGVWVVVALATVLVPIQRETLREARFRVVGTVVGALTGSLIATVLPAFAVVIVALAAALLGIASNLAHRRQQFVAYIAVATVTATATVGGEAAADVALQRVGYTLVGAAIAVALGLGVARIGHARAADAA